MKDSDHAKRFDNFEKTDHSNYARKWALGINTIASSELAMYFFADEKLSSRRHKGEALSSIDAALRFKLMQGVFEYKHKPT